MISEGPLRNGLIKGTTSRVVSQDILKPGDRNKRFNFRIPVVWESL